MSLEDTARIKTTRRLEFSEIPFDIWETSPEIDWCSEIDEVNRANGASGVRMFERCSIIDGDKASGTDEAALSIEDNLGESSIPSFLPSFLSIIPSISSGIPDDPGLLGLPFTSWYPNQQDAIRRIIELPPGGVLFLEKPTGGGKSGVAAAVSHYRPGTTVIIGTRDLQGQYINTLPKIFKAVWGRAHYPCTNEKYANEFQSIHQEPPSREDCIYTGKLNDCPYYPCPYERAKLQAIKSRARALNYHYAFYAQWWHTPTRDLFCDEAHTLSNILSGLVSIAMSEWIRRKYGLPPFPLAIGHAPYALERARDWACQCVLTLESLAKFTSDIKLRRSAETWRIKLQSMAKSIQEDEEAGWHIQSKPGDVFRAEPVVPAAFSKSILVSNARSYVLMSATIGNPAVLARELGISDYEFVSYPHIIPVENRPVLLYKDAPRMSYKADQSAYDKQIELLLKILNNHKGEKGIVHTASWKHAQMLYNAIRKTGRNAIMPEAEKRIESVERFKQAEDGTIAVSPSWNEGLDFPDDLCRFTVIAKVEYPSLANPVTKLKLERRGGRDWYEWTAALKCVQAAGRAVRHPEDFAVTYILDGNWTRVARHAPKWFEWTKI